MKNSYDTIGNRPDNTVTEIGLSLMSAIKYVSEYRTSAKILRVNNV